MAAHTQPLKTLLAHGLKFATSDRSGTSLESGGDTEIALWMILYGYTLWYSLELVFFGWPEGHSWLRRHSTDALGIARFLMKLPEVVCTNCLSITRLRPEPGPRLRPEIYAESLPAS